MRKIYFEIDLLAKAGEHLCEDDLASLHLVCGSEGANIESYCLREVRELGGRYLMRFEVLARVGEGLGASSSRPCDGVLFDIWAQGIMCCRHADSGPAPVRTSMEGLRVTKRIPADSLGR